jgi:hypothetical protein
MEFLFQGQKIGEGAFALRMMNSEGAGTASTNTVSLCDLYRTLCKPYSGPQPVGPFNLPGYPGAQPIYTPETLAPAMPMVVQSALDALPPAVRQALYRPEFAEAVRSGAIDRRIAGVLGSSVVPLLRIINGCGPGGACYTNVAALELLKGTSPLWPLGASMSPYALPLDSVSACTATGACH